MEEKQYTKAHKLILSNRRTGTVTGVADVISFDITEDNVKCSEKGFNCLFRKIADGYICSTCERN